MLRRCGIRSDVVPARLDEAALKSAMLSEGASARDIVDALAETKAHRVSLKFPERVVIGCDQVLVCDGNLYNKPVDLDECRSHLRNLRGKSHELLSAAVVFDDQKPVWRYIGRAQLTMRQFSDTFLESYINQSENDRLTTLGGYKLELDGPLLFQRIEGDYFSVLGMPLLELLAFLRTRGISPL